MGKIATKNECYEINNEHSNWWRSNHCPTRKEILDTEWFNVIGNYNDNQLVQLTDIMALPSCELYNNTSSNAKVGSADVAQATISSKSSASLSKWKNKTLEWHILSSPVTAKSGENICIIIYGCPTLRISDIVDVSGQSNFTISFNNTNSYSKVYFTLKNNSYTTSNPIVVGNYMINLNRFKRNNCSFKIFLG